MRSSPWRRKDASAGTHWWAHKDVAAELQNVLVGRTGLDVDQQRAGDILGLSKSERQALRELEPGTFYGYGGAISRGVTLLRTGAVLTKHPEAGVIGTPAPPPPAALAELIAELRHLAPSPTDVMDMDQARAIIARLETTLNHRTPVVERIEVPVVERV